MRKRIHFAVLGLLISSALLGQQPLNDDCFTATAIPTTDMYCSIVSEFTNLGAMSDPSISNTCFLDFTVGVWFSFVPSEPAVNIQVFGTENNGGTMGSPQMGIFEGSCNSLSLVECSPGTSAGLDELVYSGLVIGQRYFLYVESAPSTTGTFRLCINDFIAPPSPESDCPDAVVLCDKSPFVVQNLNTAGNDINELSNLTICQDAMGFDCISSEFASAWYVWTCQDPGSLTFTLTPNDNVAGQITDDLDFLVLELPNGIGDCSIKNVLRCMASGANTTNGIVNPLADWASCNGQTGLRLGDPDNCEFPGCQGANDNNFADALNMQAGVTYALVVMNFSRSGLGFSIEFGGTGTFVGPEPNFEATLPSAEQVFECDKTIIFEDLSESLTDPIVEWSWNFGVGASSPFAAGPGPHSIVYESFGDKIVALTVRSQRGCEVTKILDLFVEPCCADINTLDIIVDGNDIVCHGELTGEIEMIGIAGDPDYQFSVNGGSFLPNSTVNGLAAGMYTVQVQDIKGCTAEASVEISEPPEFTVEVGEDQTINLGTSTFISSAVTNGAGNLVYEWMPCEGLSCCDCPNPDVFPSQDVNIYTLTITDEDGCIAVDQLTINTIFDPSFFAPNIFSPNNDGINDYFNVFAGPDAGPVYELLIFDRWGNLMYEDSAVPLNDYNMGWDGRFGTERLNPGVYTWLARVSYINNTTINYTGSITLAR